MQYAQRDWNASDSYTKERTLLILISCINDLYIKLHFFTLHLSSAWSSVLNFTYVVSTLECIMHWGVLSVLSSLSTWHAAYKLRHDFCHISHRYVRALAWNFLSTLIANHHYVIDDIVYTMLQPRARTMPF